MNSAPAAVAGQKPHGSLWWWLLPVGWAALIFFFSSGSFANANTEVILAWALGLIHVHVSASTLDTLNFLGAKSAHLSVYAVYALFLYYGFSGEKRLSWNPRRALGCILIAGLYSLTDEFHQSFVAGRSGGLDDCALDTTGALIGMVIVYMDSRLFSYRNPTTKQHALGPD